MKRNLKRICALAVVLALAAAMIFPVYAQEETEYSYTDPYVIVYQGSEELMEAYQDYCKPYLYASPHMSSMAIRDLDTGSMQSWYCSQQVYNMIDTTRLSQGGEGAYASLEVYCTDACINANGGSSYRRINLEDSTYFSDETAGKIRGVFLNSFPYIKDMDVITAAVNDYLDGLGAEHTDVSGLTAAEVVTATQYTIWALANGADVIPRSPYVYTEDYTAESLADEVVYITNDYMDCTEDARDTTSNNINMVQQYLASLEGVGPKKIVASENVLLAEVTEKIKEEDGTYTITIAYELDAEISDGDDLALSVTCGSTQKNLTLTSENSAGSVTVSGVKASENVVVEVNGYQTGGDVYLYDSTEDRSSSQSMVGYDATSLPVHAEVSVESADHILNIYKSTSESDGKKPLANIQFEIYRAASMDQIASGDVTLSNAPTTEEIEMYAVEENLVTTLTTDAAGFATYNFTENGDPDGVYLIVELPNAAVTGPVDPFYVAIPGTSTDGSTTVNTVKVYPKNTTETGPAIQKDVTEINNDHDTFDVGQTHTWIIRGSVPAGIANGICYVISDTLDYRLTYQGNLAVKVGLESEAAGAESVTLTETTHYTLTTATAADDEGNAVDTFQVSLTPDGMAAVADAVTDEGAWEVRVYFDAIINTDAQMGTNIPNQAQLEYTNELGVSYDSQSDIPEVHTGGTNILKLDSQTDSTLAGAAFQIARDATEAELADEGVAKQTLTVDGTEHTVVFVDFYTTQDLSGEPATEAVTDDQGAAVLYGLAYGEYYLVETKAPAGYNLLSTPVVVQVNEISHLEEAVITVYNAKFSVPETGGMGTTLFTVVGVGLMAGAAAVLLVSSRRKRNG